MKLFLISRADSVDYDEYDSAVVVAPDAEMARRMNPGYSEWNKQVLCDFGDRRNDWAKSIDLVEVKYIGEAAEGITGVVCASFNAG